MKSPILLRLTAVAAALFLIFSASASANQLTIREGYSERLKKNKSGSATTFARATTTSYSLRAAVKLEGVELSAINADTMVDIVAGVLNFRSRLGDATQFLPAQRKAIFEESVMDNAGKRITTRRISFSWTGTKLKVSVRGAARLAANGVTETTKASAFSGVKSGRYADAVSGKLVFGPASYSFKSLEGAARVRTREAKAGNDRKERLTSVSYKVQGKGDYFATPVRTFPSEEKVVGSVDAQPRSGGTVRVASGDLLGTQLTVPAGAVRANTKFSLSTAKFNMTPRFGTFSGEGVTVKTDGTTNFEEALQITVPIPKDENKVMVPFYVNEEGYLEPCQVVNTDRAAGVMTFESFHASSFVWVSVTLGEGQSAVVTPFLPPGDGFQVVNQGSRYNRGGECFGFAGFAQWYYQELGGGLFPRYMQDIPVAGGTPLKGQEVVATRAHTSLSRVWNAYLPRLAEQNNDTGAQTFAAVLATLQNTGRPAMLYLAAVGREAAHAVLVYAADPASRKMWINDPNAPGVAREASLDASGNLIYGQWNVVRLLGDGTFTKEPFRQIYRDAERLFRGNGAAQIEITSHTDGAQVQNRTETIKGRVSSGQVLVSEIDVILNGTTPYRTAVSESGDFQVAVSLVSGENELTFVTRGVVDSGDSETLTDLPNTSTSPFKLLLDGNAVILVTLTWNTASTDLDLYTIDPTGDYSYYRKKRTADGGELDYDDTNGFGPEHWTLLGSNTVRWNQPYRFRVHYYSDRGMGPSRWTANILLYEGTDNAISYNFSGVLSVGNSSNAGPQGAGPDWADIATIVPVPASGGTAQSARVEKNAGRLTIFVPVPDADERMAPKVPTTR
jgi:uncharacterized protein YfaP (DUF2135 family)